ncbi:MAG TPA: RNA 2',3'-cyclic phosphodiesterase [Armatimonadota bacterium]|nr:RNA 2',3'-cyclic phosphodiesterase [Armatimonadota bacterium]
MDKIRTFIAVPIPAEARRRLAEIEEELKTSGADVKWVREENFHVTLKFLAYVEPDCLDRVIRAVESAVKGTAAFDVSLSGVGAFPKASRPSVIWVGIATGAQELKALAERIESATERIGFGREQRPFSAHITAGRARSPKNLDRLREIIERLREEPVGSFRAENVAVMKSELRPTGPIYTGIADCGLQIDPHEALSN